MMTTDPLDAAFGVVAFWPALVARGFAQTAAFMPPTVERAVGGPVVAAVRMFDGLAQAQQQGKLRAHRALEQRYAPRVS